MDDYPQKRYYHRHKEEIRQKQKNYYNKNKLKITLKKTETYLNNEPSSKKLKERYNITVDDYNKMFENQQGYCVICGKHQSELKNRLSVDHSHKTGKIRGLLCPKCNTGLGLYETWATQYDSQIKEYLRTNNE